MGTGPPHYPSTSHLLVLASSQESPLIDECDGWQMNFSFWHLHVFCLAYYKEFVSVDLGLHPLFHGL